MAVAGALRHSIGTRVFSKAAAGNAAINKIRAEDRRIHGWYRFVLSFPPHLVRDYFDRFELRADQTVLDPFCGAGTTLVEAKLRGLRAVGLEAHPMSHFASSVKIDWDPDPDEMEARAERIAAAAGGGGKSPWSDDALALLLRGSMSERPLKKAAALWRQIRKHGGRRRHEALIFAKTIVARASNLRFGPEVGLRREKREDAAVAEDWLCNMRLACADLRAARRRRLGFAAAICSDARRCGEEIADDSVDAVFTSPPYPNEKDYTRTTRLESVLLGFVAGRGDLRALKKNLLCSNTRTAYVDNEDAGWVEKNSRVNCLAREIERRRIALGKTSGFERLYSRATRLYFGGMTRHFAALRRLLRPGARLGYVVGDQASYFQVPIRTGEMLAAIAESLGYEISALDLFRERMATATRTRIREEVLTMRWPG